MKGSVTFIATLSDEDGPDWGRSEAVISGGRELPIEPKQALSDVTAGSSARTASISRSCPTSP